MKKLFFLFSIISFCILSGFISSDVVFASSRPGYFTASVIGTNNGFLYTYRFDLELPLDVNYAFGLAPISDTEATLCVYLEDYTDAIYYNTYRDAGNQSNLSMYPQFQYENLYYYPISYIAIPIISSPEPILFDNLNPTSDEAFERVKSYLGSLNNDVISDSSLDIKGLSCTILNDQNNNVDYSATIKQNWNNFINAIYNEITGSVKDGIVADSNYVNGAPVTYIPGVSLVWDAPPVSNKQLVSNNSIIPDISVQYSIWVDGKSNIKYKSSASGIISSLTDASNVSSCAFSKLLIHDGSVIPNPLTTYYYNTNSGLSVILDYIENNSTWIRPQNFDIHQALALETTIGRVYIQAYYIDTATNEVHRGAVSYVDIVNGIPSVHEGTTDIGDIPVSDSDGVTSLTGQPYTVSGDNIVYGDTITNDITNNYITPGLVLPGGLNFFTAGVALIQAVLELIKLLFVSLLVPFITLGFTGHF